MYKRFYLYVCAAVMVFFLTACSDIGTSFHTNAAVVRKHPAPAHVPPQGEPKVMNFEALTRAVTMTEEELLSAKQDAIAGAAFTESLFADLTGETLKMQFYNGWLYILQSDKLNTLNQTYLLRTDGNVIENVGPQLFDGEFFTYYFSVSDGGEFFFLHSPYGNNPVEGNSLYSKYAIEEDGSFTEIAARTPLDGQLAEASPFYFGGSVYYISLSDKSLYAFNTETSVASEVFLPFDVYSYNCGSDGRLYVYYKSESNKFGVFDLNRPGDVPVLELPYNMTNVYGTLMIGFNSLDGKYYRATNNQLQVLDTETGKWDKVLAFGEETELQTVKASGTQYEYSDFIINGAGEFFIAVGESERLTGQYTTKIGKYTAKGM